MICGAHHFQPRCLNFILGLKQCFHISHFESNMLHPFGCIVIAIHFGGIRQLEESQYITHPSVKKNMHVGIRFLGRGSPLLSKNQHKVHT